MVETLLEVKLFSDEDFLKVRETLSRIGVASRKDRFSNQSKPKLFQSCHILHKQNRYYIVHFKELFALDGKQTDFSENDKGRRNTIAKFLEQWGLVQIVKPEMAKEPSAPLSQIKIIQFEDKPNWELCTKYTIGKKRLDS